MTIKRKFLLCGLLVFVALGAIGLGTGLAVRSAQRDQVRKSLEIVAGLEANRIDDLLAADANRLATDAGNAGLFEVVTAADGSPTTEAFSRLFELNRHILSAAVVDRDGRIVADSTGREAARTPTPTTPDELAQPLSALQFGAPFAAGRGYRVKTGDERFRMLIGLGPKNADRDLALVVELDLQPIQTLFGRHSELGRTDDAHLVQPVDGGAQFITEPRFRPTLRFSTVPSSKSRAPAVLAAYGAAATYDDVRDYRDVAVIASVRPVTNTPWALVVKVDLSEAFSMFNRAMTLGIIGFAAAAIFSVGALAVAAQSVLRRIRRVAESASAISAGELTARVGDLSRDELGTLARSFDTMADSLVADMARRHEIEAELAHRARHDVPDRAAQPAGVPVRAEVEPRSRTAAGLGGRVVLRSRRIQDRQRRPGALRRRRAPARGVGPAATCRHRQARARPVSAVTSSSSSPVTSPTSVKPSNSPTGCARSSRPRSRSADATSS